MKGLLIGSGVMILLLISAILVPPPSSNAAERFLDSINPLRSQRTSGERSPGTSLKTITSAQADFRANDRDNDGLHQFWRGDIAGLYTIVPKNLPPEQLKQTYPPAIKLIELSVASADAGPITNIGLYAPQAPKAGYWFRALLHADEKTPDPDRFAACAFPAKYPESGRWTFIVDENNTVFRRDLGHGRGVAVYPSEEELKSWTKLD